MLLASGGSAIAGPPWSDPVRIDVPRFSALPCGVVVDIDGRTTVASDGRGGGDSPRTYLSTRLPVGGGQFQRTLDLAGSCDSVQPSGPRSARLLLEGRAVEVHDRRVIARARIAARGPTLTEMHANLRGIAMIAWLEQIGERADDPWRLRARLRTGAGRTFGRSFTLARPSVDPEAHPLEVAVGPRGELAVVWGDTDSETRRGEIFARIKWPGRTGFGRAVRLGPGGGFPAVAAAFSNSGRLYAIWVTSRQRYAVRTASVLPRSVRVTDRLMLDTGAEFRGHLARSAVVATPDGGAVAAWSAARRTGPESEISPVQVAIAPRNGRFGTRHVLAANGELDDIEISPRTGSVLASWTATHPEVDGSVVAALRPLGSTFMAPETISGPGSFASHAAFSPVGTAVTAVWAHWAHTRDPEPPVEVQAADRP